MSALSRRQKIIQKLVFEIQKIVDAKKLFIYYALNQNIFQLPSFTDLIDFLPIFLLQNTRSVILLLSLKFQNFLLYLFNLLVLVDLLQAKNSENNQEI